MSRSNAIAMSNALIICIAINAAADEEHRNSDFEPNWSIGAGIAFDSRSIPPTSQVDASTTPFVKFGFEYLYMKPLAVFFGLDGSYMKSDESYDKRYSVGLNTGARWIANPGGSVEVSSYAALHGFWDGADCDRPRKKRPGHNSCAHKDHGFRTYRVGLEFGLVLEHKLTESLSLRIASSLAEFSYARAEKKGKEKNNINTINAALAFTPSLELRLSV